MFPTNPYKERKLDKDALTKSLAPGGPHHLLSLLVGDWDGSTLTWLEPGKLADESPQRGMMQRIHGGWFVLHEYEGSFQDNRTTGMAIYGYHLSRRNFEMLWTDTFHLGTGMMLSRGGEMVRGFSVLGRYDSPMGGEPWGWRTQLEMVDPNNLIITCWNIAPGQREVKAVETTYSRVTAIA